MHLFAQSLSRYVTKQYPACHWNQALLAGGCQIGVSDGSEVRCMSRTCPGIGSLGLESTVSERGQSGRWQRGRLVACRPRILERPDSAI